MATLRPSTGRPVSSLLRSAGSLAASEANYQDQIMKTQFDANPTTENMNAYIAYLKDRAQNLSSSGTIPNLSKALTLTNEINTAVTKSTTFNIDLITTQMMEGGATDQNKLDYLANNVLANPIVQQNPDMYAKYMNQAYSLQQSISYQQQQQQIANQVTAETNLNAQEKGFTNAEDALKANWTQLQDAVKNGDSAMVSKSFKDSMAIMAPIYKSAGIKVPKNASGDMSTAKVGYLLGLASFYEHAAVAAGPDNPDYNSYVNKATGVLQGTDLRQSLSESLAPSNLYSSSVSQNGQVSQVENAISGYRRVQVTVPGLQPVVLNVPQTTGNAQTPYAALGKGGQSALTDKLKNLGFNILGSTTSTGELHLEISDKAMKWLGNNTDLVPGERITAIPTGKGLQFISQNNNLYGISFDNRNLAGLYRAGTNNNWSHVGGQYGFNPNAPSSIAGATNHASVVLTPIKNTLGGLVQDASNVLRTPQPVYNMVQRPGGGYNFTNNGVAISAARYAQLSNTPFRTLLQNMANTGDTGAKTALNFVGNDFGYNPNAIGGNSGLYNALVWGVHPQIPSVAPSSMQLKM